MDEQLDRVDLIHWFIDLLAAAALGAAMIFAGLQLGQPALAIVASGVGCMLALVGLRRVPSGPRRFAAAVIPLVEEPEEGHALLDLEREGELLPKTEAPGDLSDAEAETVIRLVRFPARPGTSTPAEMQERIARHFAARREVAREVATEADASAALRDALRDLKRALG